jgi:hypothetical protein
MAGSAVLVVASIIGVLATIAFSSLAALVGLPG